MKFQFLCNSIFNIFCLFCFFSSSCHFRHSAILIVAGFCVIHRIRLVELNLVVGARLTNRTNGERVIAVQYHHRAINRRTRCNSEENIHKMGQQTFKKGNYYVVLLFFQQHVTSILCSNIQIREFAWLDLFAVFFISIWLFFFKIT